MEELYKKDLNDLDNHDGGISHSKSDILECEIKWTLRSTAANKASGGDGIPAGLFKILKDDAIKVLHSICQQIRKTQSDTTWQMNNNQNYPWYLFIYLFFKLCLFFFVFF